VTPSGRAIGLAAGTYINWLVVAKRLSRYSALSRADAITSSGVYQQQVQGKLKKVILAMAFPLCSYWYSLRGVCGKQLLCYVRQAFQHVVRICAYQTVMIVGAIVVILYTFLGGFLAESAIGLPIQGIVMISGAMRGFDALGMTRCRRQYRQYLENIRSQSRDFSNFSASLKPELVDG
jgi:sodium/proline symporter